MGGVWEEVQAEDGQIFYWNEVEEKSQWEKPAAFDDLEKETIENRLEHLHFRVHVDGPSAELPDGWARLLPLLPSIAKVISDRLNRGKRVLVRCGLSRLFCLRLCVMSAPNAVKHLPSACTFIDTRAVTPSKRILGSCRCLSILQSGGGLAARAQGV